MHVISINVHLIESQQEASVNVSLTSEYLYLNE